MNTSCKDDLCEKDENSEVGHVSTWEDWFLGRSAESSAEAQDN